MNLAALAVWSAIEIRNDWVLQTTTNFILHVKLVSAEN
jgi:hypothetical protein